MYVRALFFEAPLNAKRAVKFAALALLLTILGALAGFEFLVLSLPLSGLLARALDVRDYRQREATGARSEA